MRSQVLYQAAQVLPVYIVTVCVTRGLPVNVYLRFEGSM